MSLLNNEHVRLVAKAHVQVTYAERVNMFIFQRTKDGVFQMESLEPGMVYNIPSRAIHLLGGCADVEIIKQPNADFSESMSQSSECSPEA